MLSKRVQFSPTMVSERDIERRKKSMKKKNSVVLISGGDRWLVPLVARELQKRSIELRTIKIQVKKLETEKKLKLLALFGTLATLDVLLNLIINRKFNYDHVLNVSELSNIKEHIRQDEFVLLMNLPLKFPLQETPIYNFHPSLLPSFKGLMSIPNITLAKLEGKPALFGGSIHVIDESYDTGDVVWQRAIDNQSAHQNMKRIYQQCYLSAVDGVANLIETATKKTIPTHLNLESDSRVLSWRIIIYIWWMKVMLFLRMASKHLVKRFND